MQNMPIGIFRGDDTDAFSYQTIVGTIKTDLDLTGCRAVFRYLDFSMEFDPIPEDKKITIAIPADETKKFPPGLGYASLRVYDSENRLKTFSNRIMVFVATKTPMFGSDEFEVDFNVRATLEPLKFFVGPNPGDFDEYRGYVEKVINRASAEKYGLAILLDAINSDLGAADGVAATPVAVKAAYAAIIEKLTDDYYTAEQTDEAIDRVAAYYITYDAAGNPFPTRAALANAQTVYSGGQVRTPTRNDYCVVLADETHDNAEYRYIYAVADGETTGSWQPQFPVEGVMTVDQTVTKNSQNPVSGGGVWSAIWGTLSALPTGFTSLYGWCVAQLAGKASKADATLVVASDWVCSPDKVGGAPIYIVQNQSGAWHPSDGEGGIGMVKGDAQSLSLSWAADEWYGGVALTATRAALGGYVLGSQTDKPLASEAEAEALRTEAASKLNKSGGTITGNLTIGENGSSGYHYLRLLGGGSATFVGGETDSNGNLQHGILVDFQSGGDYIPIYVYKNGSSRAFNLPFAAGTSARLENIASDFSASVSYVCNALVLYASGGDSPKLYRCVNPNGHTGNWNPNDFQEATVEDILAALRTGKADASALPYAIAAVSNSTLADRTVNTATVNAATYAPSFPSETSGKSCDFYLALTSDTAGTMSATGKTFKNAKGDAADMTYAANATTAFHFTQTATNTYLVQGGNNGGGSIDPAVLNAKLDSTSVAPAFSSDSSVSYAVGSHVTYNGKLYKCTTATTGGTWVAASWTADTMTDPDAVLDITAQNQLRVVAKDGTTLWAQGYDLASTSSATLACDAANNFTFADGATTQAFTLPTAPTGKVGDFGLDIDNSANTGAATMTLTGLDTTFSVVVPDGESLTDMLAIAAGELARFYITLSTFRVNNLPTWHIVKQVVENGGAQS